MISLSTNETCLALKSVHFRRCIARIMIEKLSILGDVDPGTLPGQLSVLEVMLKKGEISCFDDILSFRKSKLSVSCLLSILLPVPLPSFLSHLPGPY